MASTAKNSSVENVLKSTLQHIEQHEEAEYKMLQKDSQKMDELTKVIRSAAEEYMRLEEIQDIDKNPGELARHLPPQRIKMIEEGLTILTYKINIKKNEAGEHTIECTRNGKTLKLILPKLLETAKDVAKSKYVQYASIIIEAILLLMQAAGIMIDLTDSLMDNMAQETAKTVEDSSLLQKALENLQKVFEDSSSSAYDQAVAIFNFLKDSYAAGILWNIIKGLCSNMNQSDWMKTAAKVTAMMVAALATGNLALIAQILLALNAGSDFYAKFANLAELDNIGKSVA